MMLTIVHVSAWVSIAYVVMLILTYPIYIEERELRTTKHFVLISQILLISILALYALGVIS